MAEVVIHDMFVSDLIDQRCSPSSRIVALAVVAFLLVLTFLVGQSGQEIAGFGFANGVDLQSSISAPSLYLFVVCSVS